MENTPPQRSDNLWGFQLDLKRQVPPCDLGVTGGDVDDDINHGVVPSGVHGVDHTFIHGVIHVQGGNLIHCHSSPF